MKNKFDDPRGIVDELQKLRKKFSGGGGFGGNQVPVKGAAAVLAVLGLAYTLYNCTYTVQGGHKAIKFNLFTGLGNKVFGSGMHLLVPFIEWPIIYDCRTRPSEISSSSGSRDLQMVDLTLRVLYKPGSDLQSLYRTLGYNYAQRLLPSVGNEVMKAVLAQYNVSELLTRRSDVSAEMSRHMIERCKQFHVDITDVAIVHLTFGKEYSAAVEAKQVAQQQAERGRFLVEQALQEKKSKVVLAEGEAESARLIGEAVKKHPGFIHLREIEAAKDIAETLASGKNRVMVDSESLLFHIIGKNDK